VALPALSNVILCWFGVTPDCTCIPREKQKKKTDKKEKKKEK